MRLRPHVSDIFESATFFLDSKISTSTRIRIQIEFARPTGIRIHSCTQNSSGKIGNGACILLFIEGTWERGCHLAYSIHGKELGPVVRRPISVNPGLNFNPGFFFFCSKTISRIIFSSLFIESNHQIVDTKRIKLNLLFKLSYLNQNFALTLGQPSFEQLPGPGLDPNCYVTG